MPEIWFTSDTHYQHANVIKYSKRPFAHVDEMDETMIANWNAVVRPGDLVYHLGDFAFCKPPQACSIARRLHGRKYLIFGNHDRRLRTEPEFLKHWIWARDLAEIKVADQKVFLCHYAMLTWPSSHHGAWQLHGHSHGSLKPDPRARRVDVGVDCWGYTPVAFNVLYKVMATKHFSPIDHHGDNDDT